MLRLVRSPARRRTAFSLAELVVSIGILVLMLAVAGEVLRLTVNATGQATGVTQLNQQMRVFEETLRDDLAGVDREESLMLIQGNPINAYWTQDGKDADVDARPDNGYPHAADPERSDAEEPENLALPRADVLMFITGRERVSSVHGGSKRGPQQVVYGHANLGEYEPTGDPADPWVFTSRWTFPTDAQEPFALPAEFWHLARRSVLISNKTPSTFLLDPPPTRLDDPRILRGETDVIENYNPEEMIFTPGAVTDSSFAAGNFPTYLPLMFRPPNGSTLPYATPHARSLLDEDPPPAISYGVNHYFLPKCASFKVEWSLDPNDAHGLLDGASDVFWFDPGVMPVGNANPEPLKTLADAGEPPPPWPENDDLINLRTGSLFGHNVPGSWNELYSLEERFNGPTGDPEWRSELADNLVIFTATRMKPGPTQDADKVVVPEDIFPGALRITIDLYDAQRRLTRPTRYILVVPVGSGS